MTMLEQMVKTNHGKLQEGLPNVVNVDCEANRGKP